MARYRYILGDKRRERARLQHQASIWDPKTLALFDRLKIRRGWRALEIGPGQGSLHKELRRRVRRAVDVVEPTTKYARPGSAEWDWITTYFLGVMPQMARLRPFTPTQAASLRRHWLRAAKDKPSLLISPTVLDVVGRKRRFSFSRTSYARNTK